MYICMCRPERITGRGRRGRGAGPAGRQGGAGGVPLHQHRRAAAGPRRQRPHHQPHAPRTA